MKKITFKKINLTLLVTVIIFSCSSKIFCQSIENDEIEFQKIANEMINNIAIGDFKKATENFDPYIVKALSPEKIQQVWTQLQKAFGKFVAISDFSSTEKVGNRTLFTRHIIYEKDSMAAYITVDRNNEAKKPQIAGFYINQIMKKQNSENYVDADYVNKSKFEEISVKLADTVITGKLTIPTVTTINQQNKEKNQKIPCIVLVHGSGPNDLDETYEQNKPFRDIAYGLSSNGIAVLRYNKRTFVDKNLDVKNLTLNEETVFDAVEAVNFLRKNYSDKIGKIYILGHSLGGYALPRIAKLSHNADGFISLAGASRNLGELLVEQFEYLFSLSETEKTPYIDSVQRDLLTKVKRVKSLDFDENISEDSLPTGLTAKYLLDLKNYNPAKEFSLENRPILFLQGKRDYQVTVADFDLWKKYLGKKSNCKFVLFDDLNHFLQAGTGKSQPKEYSEKKNVDKKVIDEIAKWLEKQ